MDIPIKSVYYFRMSSQKQADNESTIAHYVDRGIKTGFKPHQIFYDVGSGGSRERENYQLILARVSKGDINRIYLPNDLSRLLRDVEEFKRLQKLFIEANVSIFNLSGSRYRFEEPEQILLSDVQMSFYEFERNRNKYKAIQGHKYLREHGKALQAIFPYVKQNGTLYPNTSEYKNTDKTVWEVGKELINVYLDCNSSNETINRMTAKYNGVINGVKRWEDFSRTAAGLTKWLKSEFIRGNLHYKKTNEIAYSTHDPLIDNITITRLDKLLNINSQGRKSTRELQNIWKGVAFCECGAPMRVHMTHTKRKNWQKSYRYFVCSEAFTSNSRKLRRRRLGLEVSKCNHTTTYSLTIEKMENLTIECLIQKAEDIANSVFKEPTKIVSAEVEQLQAQIKKYKLLAQNDEDLLPVLNKKQLQLHKMLEGSKSNDEIELEYLRKSLASFGKSKEFWDQATRKEKLVLFNDFISKIICTKGVPTFSFKV